jgi:hypothetical protein
MTVWSLMARCPVEAAVPEPVNPIPYVISLAQPVQSGMLPLPRAQAGVRAVCYRLAREGRLGGDGDPEGWFGTLNSLLCQHVHQLQARFDTVAGGIERGTWDMVRKRRSPGEMRQAAHERNRQEGWPLTSDEVNAIVTDVLYRSLPRRRFRHG